MVELSLGERIKVAAKSLAELGVPLTLKKEKTLRRNQHQTSRPEVWSNQEKVRN